MPANIVRRDSGMIAPGVECQSRYRTTRRPSMFMFHYPNKYESTYKHQKLKKNNRKFAVCVVL
jgi:hypothetical protein